MGERFVFCGTNLGSDFVIREKHVGPGTPPVENHWSKVLTHFTPHLNPSSTSCGPQAPTTTGMPVQAVAFASPLSRTLLSSALPHGLSLWQQQLPISSPNASSEPGPHRRLSTATNHCGPVSDPRSRRGLGDLRVYHVEEGGGAAAAAKARKQPYQGLVTSLWNTTRLQNFDPSD